MKAVNKKTFNKFFRNPPAEKYKAYKKASELFPIKEHIHFLSQIAHESCFLKYKKESHSYSLKRIKQVFRKYFKGMSDKKIQPYVRSPKLLHRVYANRMGNGNEESKDGGRFRGRGYIQLTGKNNYKKFGYIKTPDKLLEELDSWIICFKFWRLNDIDSICDNNPLDVSKKEVKKITRRINGGYNGYPDRLKKGENLESIYHEFKKLEKLFN